MRLVPVAGAERVMAAVSPVHPVATAGAAPPIRVERLTHVYPIRPRLKSGSDTAPPVRSALDDVSFTVEPGEIFGVLGPNGGGKTTLFRILATMLAPRAATPASEGKPAPESSKGRDAARVEVFGHDVIRDPRAVRQHLGVVFQTPSLDVKLTAGENLLHHGHLYGLRGADLRRRIDESLGRAGLLDRKADRVEVFSGGTRRRVELAKAMLHAPGLLLLDEPATGLDPGARRDLWSQLEHLRRERGVTIALTTHLMEEADRCDRLAILARGRLVALDTPANLKRSIGGDVITIEAEGGAGAAEALRQQIEDRFAPWREGGRPVVIEHRVHMERDEGPAFVATLAGVFSGRIRTITVGRPTLEDVFLHLTGRALHAQGVDR